MPKAKAVIIMAEKRAPKKYQNALWKVLRKYGFGNQGCAVYLTADNVFGINLKGIRNRKMALRICNETIDKIGVSPK